MNKLLILVGISGSGKSTFASTTVRHNPERYVVVNRDKIREMAFGYTEDTISEYYTRNDLHRLEKEVTNIENSLIKEGLSRGKDVIVDATHLKKEYIERFKFFNVDTDLIFFDITLEEAIERDSLRRRKVGKDIIKRQFDSYKHIKSLNLDGWYKEEIIFHPHFPPCIVFDIDGTLAHKGNRNPYDWKNVGKDSVDLAVSYIYTELSYISKKFGSMDIIVCTGRDAICERQTEDWFAENNLPLPKELHIRKEGDNRPDWIVKREMWEDISNRYNIIFIVDDRCQVVDYARSLGIKVFQVEYGNF